MRIEDLVEAGPVRAPGQPVQPATQPPDAARLDEDQEQEDEDGEGQTDEGRSGERLDEGVEVDRAVLRLKPARGRRAARV